MGNSTRFFMRLKILHWALLCECDYFPDMAASGRGRRGARLVAAGFLLTALLRPGTVAAEGQFETGDHGPVYSVHIPGEQPAGLEDRDDLPAWGEITEGLEGGRKRERDLALGPAIAREGAVSLQYQVDVLSQGQELLFAVVTPGASGTIGRPARSSRRFGTVELSYPGDVPEAGEKPGSVVALIYDRRREEVVASAAQPVTRRPATLQGRLLNERGAPVPDRRVLLCSDFLCFPGNSDPAGDFVIEEIPAGAYELRVGTLDAPVLGHVGLRSGERRSLPPLRTGR